VSVRHPTQWNYLSTFHVLLKWRLFWYVVQPINW